MFTELHQSNFRFYTNEVLSLHKRAENLLKLEDRCRQKEAELLAEARKGRAETRHVSTKDLEDKLSQLNESLVAEELELERKYRLFERNLRDNK